MRADALFLSAVIGSIRRYRGLERPRLRLHDWTRARRGTQWQHDSAVDSLAHALTLDRGNPANMRVFEAALAVWHSP